MLKILMKFGGMSEDGLTLNRNKDSTKSRWWDECLKVVEGVIYQISLVISFGREKVEQIQGLNSSRKFRKFR